MNMQTLRRTSVRTTCAVLIGAMLAASAGAGGKEPLAPSRTAAGIDQQIDWSKARLIAVQDAGRYKTLDSFARESMSAMYGKEHLPGLSPLASLMEWLFKRDAYTDEAVVYIRDKGLRIDFSAHLPPAERDYITRTGYMTPRQLANRAVQGRIQELEPKFSMVTAIRRVRDAQVVVGFMDELIRLVPPAEGSTDALWHTPQELVPNLTGQAGPNGEGPVQGVTPQQSLAVLTPWSSLREAWLRGDAAGVQRYADQLAEVLPKLSAAGVYPAESQRKAEAHYYAMGKFTWGWMVYFLATLASVWLLATGWPAVRVIAFMLLLAALGIHAYGLGVRWYILGRIPVANMFEAVVASAWVGIALGMLAELRYRTAVFALGASVTGFCALILAQYVIPGGGTLTTIMGILDDVMLRIHTTLIISSYALIFLAGVIAVAYLFGYYLHTAPGRSSIVGGVAAVLGGLMLASAGMLFIAGDVAGQLVKPIEIRFATAALTVAIALQLAWLVAQRWSGVSIAITGVLLMGATTLAIGNHDFIVGTSVTLLVGGFAWALFTAGAHLALRMSHAEAPAVALAGAGGSISPLQLKLERPVLAGGAPGDENLGDKLPKWLHTADWSHLITLNMVFVMLFVGIILGAIWADYSWGRPWGWDPKEVFAMNTWIIYAILIHVRFIVKQKGLWTAWLSVAGCAMMAFNWVFVNFFIVGLHSYA